MLKYLLNILPNSLNIIGKMKLLPLSLFVHVIFFPKTMIFPFSLHNLIFFHQRLDKIRRFIHPCFKDKTSVSVADPFYFKMEPRIRFVK